MIIENRRHEEKIEKTIKIARINKEDIKDLIIEYLNEAFGIKDVQRNNIYFNTNWKYASDEWGMNRTIVTSFEGITVELQEVEE